MSNDNLTPELSITVLESEGRPPPPRVERTYTFTQLREMFGEDEGSAVCALMELAESQARYIAGLERKSDEASRYAKECEGGQKAAYARENELAQQVDDLRAENEALKRNLEAARTAFDSRIRKVEEALGIVTARGNKA